MEKRKLWIVSELFYPDETSTAYLLTKISKTFVDKYSVNVICGHAYSENSFTVSFDLSDSINIHRVNEIKLNKNKLITRAIRTILLSFLLVYILARKVKKGDKVMIVTNPAPMLILVSILKKIKGFEYVILVHDVFPENTIPISIFSSSKNCVYRLLKSIFNWAYKKADLLIVCGRDMKEIILSKTGFNQSKVEVVENWADKGLGRDFSSRKSENIILQFAGNLGRVQGLISLLQIIANTNNSQLEFQFWGSGAVETEMNLFIKDNKLSNVSMNGAYKRKDQNSILSQCDIAIVTLADGMYGLGVPSKSYNILAAGKAILFIGDLNSEIALMVKEHGVGYCFDATDVKGISSFLSTINIKDKKRFAEMGVKSKILAEERYSEDIILNKYKQLI